MKDSLSFRDDILCFDWWFNLAHVLYRMLSWLQSAGENDGKNG